MREVNPGIEITQARCPGADAGLTTGVAEVEIQTSDPKNPIFIHRSDFRFLEK